MALLANIDVPDLKAGIAFYAQVFVGRQWGAAGSVSFATVDASLQLF